MADRPLSPAQRRALENPGSNIPANTRRSLINRGLIDADGSVTSAGRAALSAPSGGGTATSKLAALLEDTENPASPRTGTMTAPENPAIPVDEMTGPDGETVRVGKDKGVVKRVAQGSMKWMDFLSEDEKATYNNAKDLGDTKLMRDIRNEGMRRSTGGGPDLVARVEAEGKRAPTSMERVQSRGARRMAEQTMRRDARFQAAQRAENATRASAAAKVEARLDARAATRTPETVRPPSTPEIKQLLRGTQPDRLTPDLANAGKGTGVLPTAETRLPFARTAAQSVGASTPSPAATRTTSPLAPRLTPQGTPLAMESPLPGLGGSRPLNVDITSRPMVTSTAAAAPSTAPRISAMPVVGEQKLGLPKPPISTLPTADAEFMARYAPASGTGGPGARPSFSRALAESATPGGGLTAGTPASATPAGSPATGMPSAARTMAASTLDDAAMMGGGGLVGEAAGTASAAAKPGMMSRLGGMFGGGAGAAEAAGAASTIARGGKIASFARGAVLPALPGLAASVGGSAIQAADPTDTEGVDWHDLGQGLSGAGIVASLGVPAALALGAGPMGWAALGIGALGVGLYSALRGGGDSPQDRLEKVKAAAAESGMPWDEQDQAKVESIYNLLVAGGKSEDEAATLVADQVLASAQQYLQSGSSAENEMTPQMLMALQAQYQKALADSQAYYDNIADTTTASRMQELQSLPEGADRTALAGMTAAARERSAHSAWASQLAALTAPTVQMYNDQIEAQNAALKAQMSGGSGSLDLATLMETGAAA